MGQALTKHHWHGADRFLVEAHLHVPEHQNSPQYRRQQKQPAREPATPRPDTPPRSLGSSPEQNPESTDIESSATSDAGSSLPSSSSSDGDHLLTFTSLPPEEARAIAAANWIEVLDQAASFKHVYLSSLTDWISRQQASAAASAPKRPPQHTHSRSTSNASSKANKPDDDAADDSSTPGDQPTPTASSQQQQQHHHHHHHHHRPPTSPTPASPPTWTPADLISLATRAGPLRCYRWHSTAGTSRAAKARSRMQLLADASLMRWNGELLVGHLRSGPDDTPADVPADDDGAVAPPALLRQEFGDEGLLRSVAVRAPAAVVVVVVDADADAGGGCGCGCGAGVVEVPARQLELVKLLSTFFPQGAPWTGSAAVGGGGGGRRYGEEEVARIKRVWVAMALGWAWAVEGYVGVWEEGKGEDGEGEGEGEDEVAKESGYEGEDEGRFEEWGDWDVGSDEEAVLEEMSEVGVEDGLVVPVVAMDGGRRGSLLPSDGSDDEGKDEESTDEEGQDGESTDEEVKDEEQSDEESKVEGKEDEEVKVEGVPSLLIEESG